MTATTDADATRMSMKKEAESYANGAWECSVEYVSEGRAEDAERFFDLSVPGDRVPSGLLQNLQARGYTIVGISAGSEELRITASPDK